LLSPWRNGSASAIPPLIWISTQAGALTSTCGFEQRRRIGLTAAFMTTELVLASPESANVIIYCQNVDYPAHCVARPGVVLGVRPVARAAAREAVRPGTPTNRGGPVDRADRR
jgi:hypothetical protein